MIWLVENKLFAHLLLQHYRKRTFTDVAYPGEIVYSERTFEK